MSQIKERRKIFRINTKLPLSVDEYNHGEMVDLSEGGIAFLLPQYLGEDIATIKITADGNIFTSSVRILRKKQIPEEKWFYAGEFQNLKKEEMAVLRDIVFNALAEECLNRTKKWPYHDEVKNFVCNELKSYLTRLRELVGTEHSNALCDPKVLDKITNEIVKKGHLVEKHIDHKTLSSRLKGLFRMTAGHWAFQSKVMWHAYKKPRGYPGDYWLMETIYDNRPISDTPLGKLFDLYYLNNPYALAVRSRKDMMRSILDKIFSNGYMASPYRVLNIACGSSREVFELAQEKEMKRRLIDWTFLDHDNEALNYCKKKQALVPKEWRCQFTDLDILKMVEDPASFGSLKNQNLIYTIGLADYLPDRVLKKFLHLCYFDLLASDGLLIVAHKDENEDPFAPVPPDWFCDWNFYSRSFKEFKTMVTSIGVAEENISHSWESSHRVFFLQINKPKTLLP